MGRQRINFILHITAVLPSPVQCCDWEMFLQVLRLPALPHCASLFPHSMSFGWGFHPVWEQVTVTPQRINNSGVCSRLLIWFLCPNNFFKVIQNLSWFFCLSVMECSFSSPETGNNLNSSYLLILWNMRVWSIFHFTFPRCLHLFQIAALWHAHAACMKLLAVDSWQKVMNRATMAFMMIHFSLTSWGEVALKLLPCWR